jgi:hypothetical protein
MSGVTVAMGSTGGLALIASNGITISGYTTLTNVLLWAGNGGNITISGWTNFTGDVVSRNFALSGFVTFNQGTILVQPPLKTITLSPTSLPDGTVNVPYSQTITASGGTSPYTFSVTSGSLPGWASLNSTGNTTCAISGTPPATGTSTFTVTATDANKSTGSQGYTLKVDAATLGITTTSLPYAIAGVPYSSTVSASGGTPSYTWTATGLPGGLSIDSGTGTISGTPTIGDPQNNTVTIKVADSGSPQQSAQTSFDLIVYPTWRT